MAFSAPPAKISAPVFFHWQQGSVWQPLEIHNPDSLDYLRGQDHSLEKAGFNAELWQLPYWSEYRILLHSRAIESTDLRIVPYFERWSFRRVGRWRVREDVLEFADQVENFLSLMPQERLATLSVDGETRLLIGLWYVPGAREADPGGGNRQPFLKRVASRLRDRLGIDIFWSAHRAWKRAGLDEVNWLFKNPEHLKVEGAAAAIRPGFWNPGKNDKFVPRDRGRPFRKALKEILRDHPEVKRVWVESHSEDAENSMIRECRPARLTIDGRTDDWGRSPAIYLRALERFHSSFFGG